jgi:hypothetical protein
MHVDGRLAQGQWALICLLCFSAIAEAQTAGEALRHAQQLAWKKEFAAAEKAYRQMLRQFPASRDARFGLAQTMLWEGRYRDARRLFDEVLSRNRNDVEAAEGMATAAYWQGDFRTAQREFAAIASAHPDRRLPSQVLSEIRSAERGDFRAQLDGLRDDQPYRAWRSSGTVSSFSDPLTRWDVSAGTYHVNSPTRGVERTEPFATVGNELVFPWQRLTLTTSAGVLRWPDGRTGMIGGATLQRRLTRNTAIALTAERRELLTNASSIATHTAVTRVIASWSRYAPRSWLAGFEAGSNRYYDRNSGAYAQAYGLWPVAKNQRTTARIGASAAARNTDATRFELDAVSSTRIGAGDFEYSYRGSYRGYWTPRDFREARAIVSVETAIGIADVKAQVEGGVARDQVRGFGPASGTTPLPSGIFSFDFNHTFHPYRVAAGVSVPIASDFRFECAVERNVTSFYAANAVRASLVQHR